MMRSVLIVQCVLVSLTLSACGESPQSLGASISDDAPYKGAEGAFVLPGWKAGDRTSWEQALKARAMNTQNEYSRAK